MWERACANVVRDAVLDTAAAAAAVDAGVAVVATLRARVAVGGGVAATDARAGVVLAVLGVLTVTARTRACTLGERCISSTVCSTPVRVRDGASVRFCVGVLMFALNVALRVYDTCCAMRRNHVHVSVSMHVV